MKKLILLTAGILMLGACNPAPDNTPKTANSASLVEKVTGKKFFEYDEIDHYFNDYNGSSMNDLYRSKSPLDSLKADVILGNTPKDIFDLSFVDKLEKIGYKKSIVDKSKFAEIDKLFVEKKAIDPIAAACIYVFRDILIFKRNNNIIGTAKICFRCRANQITGTSADTEDFGQDGDYDVSGNF